MLLVDGLESCSKQIAELFAVQILIAYSTDGLTGVVYAAVLTYFGHACMLYLRKPMVRLDSAVMLLV